MICMKKKLLSSKNTFHEGAIILLISTALVKIIGALFKIPLASDYCLGDLGFGYFSSVYDLFTPFATLALAGLPMAISKLIADNNAKKGEISTGTIFTVSRTLAFKVGIFTAVCFAVLAVPYSYLTDGSNNLVLPIIALLPALLTCYLTAVYRGLFEGLSNMVPAAVSSIIEALGKLILGFGLAFAVMKLTSNALYGSFAAVFGISLGSVLSLLYVHKKYKNDGQASPLQSSDENVSAIKKVIIITAFQIAFVSLANTFVGLIDTLTVRWQMLNYSDEAFATLLENYAPLLEEYNAISGEILDKTDLPTVLYGIRSKAFTVFNLIPTLVISVSISAVPMLSATFSSGNKDLLEEKVSETLRLASIIIFPASFGSIAVANRITDFLYGKTVSSLICGDFLKIYGIAAVFVGFSIVFGTILQGVGKEKKAFINIIAGLIIKLVLNFVFVGNPNSNILGSAYSTLVAFVVIFVFNFVCVAKQMKLSIILKSVYKPFIAAVLCVIPAVIITRYFSSSFATLLAVGAAAAIYLILLLIFKTFQGSEIAKILKKDS